MLSPASFFATQKIYCVPTSDAVGVAVGIAIERSYWNGYDDAYNSVQAEYERGVGDGWRGCIEENNLYDRY